MGRERGERLMSRHHRLPKSLGGGESDRNISIVEDRKHRGWHLAFDTKSPCELARDIMQKWIPHNFTMTAEREHGCDGCPWGKKCSLKH